jgi:hypothetical protein
VLSATLTSIPVELKSPAGPSATWAPEQPGPVKIRMVFASVRAAPISFGVLSFDPLAGSLDAIVGGGGITL